jgi:benzoate-CoA ligase family protein
MTRTPGAFNAATWLVDRHVDGGRGGAPAFVCDGEVLSYAGLQAETWRAAVMLQRLGVEPGDRVLMVVSDEFAFPAVFLGGLRIAAVPIPVSTMLKAPEVAVLAADSGATVVVVSQPYAGYLPAIARAAPSVRAAVVVDSGEHTGAPAPPSEPAPPGVPAPPGGLAPPSEPAPLAAAVYRWSEFAAAGEVPAAPTTPETPGFWLYTSGTTGRPKGAIHRHGDIRAVAETYGATVLGMGPGDVCYSVPKLFFAFGLGNALIFPLAVGASAVIDPRPPSPARAAELAVRHRPTLFFAPPGFCAALADAGLPGDTLASARATITAGETLPAEVYRRFRERFGVEMLDGIGSTEALHIFCSNHLGDVRPGTTGRVVAGYELRLTDDEGREITEAETPGALWVRGASVAAGYWQRPDVNALTFVDGWCRTGDVYRRSAEGHYVFVGRNSDMIKAGGIWVSPAEVESVILEHPSVLEAAVVGARDDDGLETTIAFVVPGRGRQVDPDEILAHCRERMAAFKRPRRIHVVDALPKTATGKIQRYALRDRLRRPDRTAHPVVGAPVVAGPPVGD